LYVFLNAESTAVNGRKGTNKMRKITSKEDTVKQRKRNKGKGKDKLMC